MSGWNDAAATIRRWRQDTVAFVTECLKAEPDRWQLDVLRAFNDNRRIGMKACKGPGKTAVLAWLIWCFLATRPHPKIAATSISRDNLADGLWTELAHWQSRSPFLKARFEVKKTRVEAIDHPETWWASARSWAKGADQTQQANTLAGLHADYLLFVLDEVGGIPDAVMAAAEAGLATGKETKILMAGNPTHLEGPLYRASTTERHLWWLIEITADPDDPNRTPRVSVEWAREQIDKYGPDNPWVLVNVFGRFPPASLNTLLGPDEVSEAMRRHLKEDAYAFSQKRIGVDPARFGDDRTVLAPRQGLAWRPPVILRNADTTAIAARLIAGKVRWGSELEFVDDTGGYGAGVIDNLRVAGYSPQAINASGKPIDSRFFNKRAECWWEMAQAVKRGAALPPIPSLQRELTTPTYTLWKGKLRLEEKDQIKKRLGYSPDIADAYSQTFALPDMPGNLLSPHREGGRQNFAATEFDPFSDRRAA